LEGSPIRGGTSLRSRRRADNAEAMLRLIRERYHPMHRLRGMRWFRWVQRRFDFPVYARIHGLEAAVLLLRDFPATLGRGGEEEEVEAAIRAALPVVRPERFLDVGANLGVYSWLVRSLAPETRLLLFEPEPRNAELLRRTIKKNRLGRVEIVQAAVSNRAGTTEFLRDDVSGKAGGVVDTRSNQASIQAVYRLAATIGVRTVTLDDFRGESPEETLVKIDAEGAESLVLAGAERFVELHRPVIVVEAFERKELDRWCAARDYFRATLDRKGNHLLLPNERERLAGLRKFGLKNDKE
jgi:FkbM family methyltransferase